MSNKIIVKDHKYYFKIRGLGGVKGDTGPAGPQGPQGPQGPYVDVVAGTTTTLPAGSSAQVTVNNIGNTSVLNLGIPQGLKGDKGDAGTPGTQGPRGFAATVNVGQTTTGEPGTDASVINAGNEHDAVFKFTIPKGEKGDTGETGPQGPTGGVKSTVVAELPETGESDKYYLVNRAAEGGTVTTTDGYAQITNDENAGDLTLNKLNGNATQKTLSGKNLFGFTDGTSTIYDVLFTINGTDVSAKGVSSKASYAQNTNLIGGLVSNGNYPAYTNVTADNSLDLAPGTYTLSATLINSGNTQAGLYIGVGTTGSTISSGEKLSATGSKTVTLASGQRLYISVWYEGNASALNVDFKATNIQLEAGTATAYEPYCGGTPSPNPDFPQKIKTVTGAQTVKITGKNLCTNAFVKDSSSIQFNCDIASISGNRIALSAILDVATSSNSVYAHVDGVNTGVRLGSFTGSANEVGGAIIHDLSQIASYLENGKELQLILYKSGAGFTSVSDAMIVNGDTLQDFEPYQGQSQEINLGKNIFDLKQFLTDRSVSYTEDADGSLTFNLANSLNNTPLQFSDKDTTVSVQAIIENITSTNAYIELYNSANTRVARLSSSTAKAENVSACKLKFDWQASGQVKVKNAQLERGFVATPYAPYKTPLELAKIGTYQDYIWNDDGTWKIHKEVGKVVFDGTEAGWGLFSNNNAFYSRAYDVQKPSSMATAGAIMANYYTAESEVNIYNAGVDYGIGISSQNRFLIRNKDITTVANLKTWLGTHNTTVYYPLATPTDTEITDSELIAQLNHIYELYQGTNNIMLIPSAGPQGELALSYVLYDKYNQHQVYIWSSDDNTWQIILP